MRVPGDIHKGYLRYLSTLIATFFLLPASLFPQLSRLTVDLSNTFSQFSRGRTTIDVRERRYDQLYTLDVAGYALEPNLMSFSLRSGLRDQSVRAFGYSDVKSRSRSFDLYNFNIDFFRRSPIPVSLYGSRNTQTNSYAYSSAAGSTTYETFSNVLGFNAAVQGNSYWPNLRMNWNRSSTEGTSPLNPFDTHTNNIQVSMANSDDEGISSYSLDYRSTASQYALNKYVRFTDPGNFYLQPPRKQNFLSASVLTTMWENVGVRTDFNQQNQDNITNRGMGLNLLFHTGAGFAHTTSARQHRNSGFGVSTNSQNVVHSVSITGSGQHSGRIQGEFTNSETNSAQFSQVYQRFAAGGSWNGFFEVSESNELRATAGGTMGSEGYRGLSRVFTYNLSGNAVFTSRLSDWLRSTLSDDIAIQRYLAFGRTFTNRAQLSLQADPGLATSLRSDLSYSDSRFLDQRTLPRLAITEGSIGATTSIIPSFSISLSFKRALYRSIFRNLFSSVSASVFHRGLARNLTASANVDFTKSSYPQVETVRLYAGFTYQFYAYSLTGNYVVDRFAGFKNQGFYFGIQRQFSFDFQ